MRSAIKMHACSFQSTVTEEHMQNMHNSCLATDMRVAKRKRFLSRQILKLKKILKVRTNLVDHKDLSLEEMQNAHNEQIDSENRLNERLERQYQKVNTYNECHSEYDSGNWDNWDACYLCAGQGDIPEVSRTTPPSRYSSICYVYMPGQADPVPVKLRNTRIPGGVMWISYRPDLDIHTMKCCSYTSAQSAQAQQARLLIV